MDLCIGRFHRFLPLSRDTCHLTFLAYHRDSNDDYYPSILTLIKQTNEGREDEVTGDLSLVDER